MRWFPKSLGRRQHAARTVLQPSVALHLEECESRLVPSGTTTSDGWSGYAVNSTADSVTAVSGSWTVPTVTGTGTSYASTWVGIDGYLSNTVEQTGVAEDLVKGVAKYSAWYEMYPSAVVTINLSIHPGDQISASVKYVNGKFDLTIEDLSDPAGKNTFTIDKAAPAALRASAEWIEEDPLASYTQLLPLSNFGSVTFTNAQATIKGVTGPINNSSWSSRVEAIDMVSTSGALEASTSALNSTGNGFTIIHEPATVSPPVSPPPVSPPPVSPPPVSPPPISPPPVSPPTTSPVTTTTTLKETDAASTYGLEPIAEFAAIVSPAVPVGGVVELLSGTTVVATGRLEDIGGVDEVTFIVEFAVSGTFTFSAKYLGDGEDQPSTSNSVTITVPGTVLYTGTGKRIV
jgi:hypothetical protein